MVRRSSCHLIAFWILAWTSSLVTWSLYEMHRSWMLSYPWEILFLWCNWYSLKSHMRHWLHRARVSVVKVSLLSVSVQISLGSVTMTWCSVRKTQPMRWRRRRRFRQRTCLLWQLNMRTTSGTGYTSCILVFFCLICLLVCVGQLLTRQLLTRQMLTRHMHTANLLYLDKCSLLKYWYRVG